MIDLHCHSNFSDGDLSPSELLNKAENMGLSYFSITDHNNCFAYEKIDTSKFRGTLIRGVEIATSFNQHIIEILGYGMKIEEINEWNKIERSKESEYAKMVYEKLINIFENNEIYYTKDYNFKLLLNRKCTTGTVKKYFYKDLLKYKQNIEIIGEEPLKSYSDFNKKGLNNPNSILFINESTRFLDIKDAIELIHRNNGLCFLAHVYQYNVGNHIEFLDNIFRVANLDGIEAYHSSFTKVQTDQINQYADAHNLYKSGGSDYHGSLKPGIDLNNLHISEELIKPWLSKIEI